MSLLHGITDRGMKRLLQMALQRDQMNLLFYMALLTDAVVPGKRTNTFGELAEIDAGGGYSSGGIAITPSRVGFVDLTQDSILDRAWVRVQDVEWIVMGPSIPATGPLARYAVLIDDNATLANRDVFAWWDFGTGFIRLTGESFIVSNAKVVTRQPPP